MKAMLLRAATCRSGIAAACILAALPLARAQETLSAAGGDANVLTEVIVTGTRQGGLEAAQSPAPIQIISPKDLEAASGNPDLMQTLAQIVPSLQAQGYGYDMANQTLQARLKGLSPNHVLVLVNGKRRHTTANIAVDPYVSQGGASTDLNFIPVSAIDHIEVLTEGAAAQYGSDAIAGVINIILKNSDSGATLDGTYGANYDEGPSDHTLPFHMNGATSAVSANFGLAPFQGSYLNVTLEAHNHGFTEHVAKDPRTTYAGNLDTYPDSNIPGAPGWPYVNFEEGDAETHSRLASFNAGFQLAESAELYSFGTYGSKDATSWENYRPPTAVQYTDPLTGATTYPYPYGFEPQEGDQETDYAGTIGVKGKWASWNWDLSTTFGRDHHDQYTLHSANPGLYALNGVPTPQDYFDGSMTASQWTTNLDLNRDFDVGMAGPLNVAYGLEYRRDTFAIGAGELDSYLDGGPSSFAGFAPDDAGAHSRTNYAGYVDLAGNPIDGLRLDLAGRHEHFSDFGDATVGKLTARYDFTPEVSLRGTVNNGFRAPTLAEEYYSDTGIGSNVTSLQLPPDGPGAKVLGLGNLKPEKSTNFSLGLVVRPQANMVATLDVYRIKITDRIVGTSGALYGLLNGQVVSPLVNEVIQASGVQLGPQVNTTSLLLFTNGIDTVTNGADLAFQYTTDFPVGQIDWSVAATYNDTQITYMRPTTPQLEAALAGSPIYSPQTLSDLTTASPRFVINLGMHWTYEKASLTLLEKIYGPSSEWEPDDGDNASNSVNWYRTSIHTTPITNLDLAYQFKKWLKVSIGANNLFNRYPPQFNSSLLAALQSPYAAINNDATGAQPYPLFAPWGIDGGFYYLRAMVTF